jgi:hypothetical protein
MIGACSCLAAMLFSCAVSAQISCDRSLSVFPKRPGAVSLYLKWTGAIVDPMSKCILTEFEKSKATLDSVFLQLDSPGGGLTDAEHTIAALKVIWRTHHLDTMVGPGGRCASACIAVFLAGERRYGALTSSWLFHEVSEWADKERKQRTIDRDATERMFQEYFLPAGVSPKWLNQLRPMIQHSDYWQTGENLWKDKSGIITKPIENLQARGTERQKY